MHPTLAAFLLTLLSACATGATDKPPSKIAIDLADVNAEGLRGPPDGLRAVHYEFCIPAREDFASEVGAIDPSAQVMKGSRGRIGCSKQEALVIGNTHQSDYRGVLVRLAALPYVRRIEESFFE